MSKKIKKRLIWIFSILISMLLLIYYLSPSISVGTVDNGVFDKGQNTSDFQKSNEMYFVTISEKNLENYSTEKIRLVDEQNNEIEIERKEISSQGKTVLWFYGKPHANYKLVYHIQKKNDTDKAVLQENFSTADKPFNLEDVYQIVEKKIKGEYDTNIKDSILDKTKEMTKSMEVYYTGYSFTVTSNWSEPDIEDLNRRINERENQLKQEVGHDFRQLYKRIINELPDLIKQTPKTATIKENKKNFNIGRIAPKAIDKNYNFSNINLFDDDFADPILNILL